MLQRYFCWIIFYLQFYRFLPVVMCFSPWPCIIWLWQRDIVFNCFEHVFLSDGENSWPKKNFHFEPRKFARERCSQQFSNRKFDKVCDDWWNPLQYANALFKRAERNHLWNVVASKGYFCGVVLLCKEFQWDSQMGFR